MQFIIYALDHKDAQSRRMETRQAHLDMHANLKAAGRMKYAAALLDGDGEHMIGSMIVCDFPSDDELDAWLKIEPYVVGRVWDKIEIVPCKIAPVWAA